jgi:hypothetical protein
MMSVLGAVAAGIGVLLAGSLPWGALLAPLNLRVFTILPWAVVPMAAYLWLYWSVSAVYGGITSAANSILPAIVLHAAANVWSLTRLWLTGRPEWQIAAEPKGLVWDTGVDGSFLAAIAALVLLSAAASWLGSRTARLGRA